MTRHGPGRTADRNVHPTLLAVGPTTLYGRESSRPTYCCALVPGVTRSSLPASLPVLHAAMLPHALPHCALALLRQATAAIAGALTRDSGS